jgi:hypothetical protein
MQIDVSTFCRLNVTDSCAAWNVLSSTTLYSAAISGGCALCCTQFVEYECLHKRRGIPTPGDVTIQQRFRNDVQQGKITVYHLDIADLQEVEILENRKRLSKGELSSIAFAKRTNQAFLTDDQKARKLARCTLPQNRVQTTPHLLGWLYFAGILTDGYLEAIISDHNGHGRPLEPHLRAAHAEAARCMALARQGGVGAK